MILLAMLLAGNFIINKTYYHYIFTKTDNGRKEQQLINYQGELKFLILGDSHMQNAIDPNIIGNSFNFSSALENYAQTFFKLRAVVEDLGKKPEYIILPVDVTGMSSFRADRYKNISSLMDFTDYYQLYKQTNNWHFLTEWMNQKFYIYAGEYRRFRNISSRQSFGSLGFKPRTGDMTSSGNYEKDCKVKADLYLSNVDPYQKDMLHYFHKILSFAENNNIQVILIKMPLALPYVEHCNNYFSVDDYYSRINNDIEKYSCISEFYDFQDYFDHDYSMYRNPDHLNFKGAKIFSEMLKLKLDKLN